MTKSSNLHCLYRVREVSQILQISSSLTYLLIQRGELPAVRISQKAVRVRYDDLMAYIQDNTDTINGSSQLTIA